MDETFTGSVMNCCILQSWNIFFGWQVGEVGMIFDVIDFLCFYYISFLYTDRSYEYFKVPKVLIFVPTLIVNKRMSSVFLVRIGVSYNKKHNLFETDPKQVA